LLELAQELPALTILHHENAGHGPTILRGYREARGEWVFQTDGDGEMDTAGLATLWGRRAEFDFLLGRRDGRTSSIGRRLVTGVARVSVGLLYGSGIHDVNAPFRLVRREWLQETVADLPADLFAPNVILSGLAVRSGLRILEIPVRFAVRRKDGGSLVSFRILSPAARSLAQTVSVALRARR
jgi:glycosyltransferase involved in cell wall biosynthesis